MHARRNDIYENTPDDPGDDHGYTPGTVVYNSGTAVPPPEDDDSGSVAVYSIPTNPNSTGYEWLPTPSVVCNTDPRVASFAGTTEPTSQPTPTCAHPRVVYLPLVLSIFFFLSRARYLSFEPHWNWLDRLGLIRSA